MATISCPKANREIIVMKTIRKCALAGAALLVASFTIGSTAALAQFVRPLPLKLINGWTTSIFGTSNPTVEEDSGIVQFRGAISTSGTNPEPFILPTQFWPETTVYVPIDLGPINTGRLEIQPNGVVTVQPESGTAFSSAQSLTSLDGASFAKSATGFHALTLRGGWTNAPFSTRNAAVKSIAGIVHFEGAIATAGTNAEPFVLPVAFRPTADVYVPVDLCDATNGRLFIQTTGAVTVEAGTFSNAQCFTSLEGVWFVQGTGSTPLTLINGWTDAPFATGNAGALNAYGVVYFQGAIASGTTSQPFVLPVAFRPITNIYVPIDLCDATNGRLVIGTNGDVFVQAENGTFSNAQCFTSLDGVSFVQ
jgi:hypothetical protein